MQITGLLLILWMIFAGFQLNIFAFATLILINIFRNGLGQTTQGIKLDLQNANKIHGQQN